MLISAHHEFLSSKSIMVLFPPFLLSLAIFP
jgi:hypothetical protein